MPYRKLTNASTFLKYTLHMKSWWESNINVLFGISFTLKPNKILTTRINCFHLCSVFFQIGNLYVDLLCNSWLNCGSTGEGRKIPPTTTRQQFPALLFAPAIEPKFVCCSLMWTLCSTTGAKGRAGNCHQPLLGGSSCPSFHFCGWAEVLSPNIEK